MLKGNEYTVEGRRVYIDFMEPVEGVLVRRHELFGEFEHKGAAMRVARLLNVDELDKADAVENPVFEMKLGESLIDIDELARISKFDDNRGLR